MDDKTLVDVLEDNISDISGKSMFWGALVRKAIDKLNGQADTIEAQATRIEALEAALREQTARADKHWRTVNDKQYMIEALVSMLGPTALTVWRGWLKKGIQRVHYSWGPDAANLSGEDRAKIMLEWDNAPRTLIPNVDAVVEGSGND